MISPSSSRKMQPRPAPRIAGIRRKHRGDDVCHLQDGSTGGIDGHMAVSRRDDHHLPGTGRDQHDIGTVPGLDQVVCLAGQYFIDLRIARPGRIRRVEMSFCLDIFPAEIPGGMMVMSKRIRCSSIHLRSSADLATLRVHVIGRSLAGAVRPCEAPF